MCRKPETRSAVANTVEGEHGQGTLNTQLAIHHHHAQLVISHRKLTMQMFQRQLSVDINDETTNARVTEEWGRRDVPESNLIHCAASQGITHVAEVLLANVSVAYDAVDQYGQTSLHCATEQGHLDVVHALLRAGVCVNVCGRCKATPLMLASLGGHEEIVCLLLCASASELNHDQSNYHTRGGTQWGSTALHYAAAGGHVGVVSILLNAGFDKEQHNEAGLTPAEISARVAHPSSPAVTRRLLPSDRGGKLVYDYVNMAMEDKHTVAGLVDGGAFLDWQDVFGDTPLHQAAHFQHVSITKMLLAGHASVNLRNRRGGSPLHVAACTGCVEVAEALLEAGADIEARMANGRSPLHLAVINNRVDIVKVLLCAGAYREHRDRIGGQTPLSEASEYCLAPIIRVLSDAGADVESRSFAGLTPLHWACRFNSLDSVDALLAAGADPDAVDEAAAGAALTWSRALGTVSSSPGSVSPVSFDVIGLGDPCRWNENPRRRFLGEVERAAEKRLDPAATSSIVAALQHARHDRAWRRRGWLVVLANRCEDTTSPKATTAPVSHALAYGEIRGKVSWEGTNESKQEECTRGNANSSTSIGSIDVADTCSTAEQEEESMEFRGWKDYSRVCKKMRGGDRVMQAGASAADQLLPASSTEKFGCLAHVEAGMEEVGLAVENPTVKKSSRGCCGGDLAPGTIEALLRLASTEMAVFQNVVCYI